MIQLWTTTNNKQEEQNWINILAKPTKPNELADFRWRIKEDHLQTGLNINIEAWQDQEGSKGSLPTAARQNRRLNQSPQATEQTEQQTACQPTLRAIESPTWCMNERGNSEEGIFIHGPRSPDPRTMLITLREPTRTAARSCAHQFSDKG